MTYTCRSWFYKSWHSIDFRTKICIKKVPFVVQCMQISWFLSTETQLHALGALVCASSVAACSRAKLISALAGAMVLAATAADVSEAYFDFEKR